MTDQPKVCRVHCNTCGHETKHAVIAERVQNDTELVEERYELSWKTTYTTLECLGCETVCLQKKFWFSEEPQEEQITFYPPQVARRIPKWAYDLPAEIRALLTEVYAALHADSRRLAMMGARAIIDMVLLAKVGDLGPFDKKLDALVKSGYVSARNRDVLSTALDAGHAAAHRGHRASVAEANHVMDIVENLLQTDILEAAAVELKTTIPPRNKVTKRSASGAP